LLIRRDCFQQLGGFAPGLFLYYEVVDLCRRARLAGWKVAFEPALAAIHHQPLHRRPVSARMRLMTRHALLTYAAKHWPGWQSWLLGRLVQVEGWLRGAWAGWHGQRRAPHRRLARIAGLLARGEQDRAQVSLRRYLRRTE
jgi:GT2 family glycosyltransferase